MNATRAERLGRLVRNHLIAKIKANLAGDEDLLKEVFEECRDDAELDIVGLECAQIIDEIRPRRR